MNGAVMVKDKRKLSGDRVLAKCELTLNIVDPYSTYSRVKTGHFVMNVRGGCLYLTEKIQKRNLQHIFPDGHTAKFRQLALMRDDLPDIVLRDLNVEFLRLREQADRTGIVFRFVDTTESQMDLLYKAQTELPAISSDEEASVPFEEVITLNRKTFHSGSLELVDLI